MPFELGRPFGAPDDPAFQTRVLMAALGLLEATSGPVLEDFPDEAPQAAAHAEDAMEGWVCPVNLGAGAEAEAVGGDLGRALRAEIALLAPWYDLAGEARGHTTADVSGLDIDAIAELLVAFLDSEPPSPVPGVAPGTALNMAAEDLKAYYLEAATARPGTVTGRRVAEWFWGETAAARLFFALRRVCSKSDDALTQRVGERLLVPLAELHRIG